MARVVGNIPNLINGVSQQPKRLRLDSQAEAQLNCYSTVAKGLIPRPGTEHVALINADCSNNTWSHWINRDTSERYVVTYDHTRSDTTPNLLSVSEQSAENWTNVTGCTDTQVEHSDAVPSFDGHSEYTRATFDGTAAAALQLTNFETMAGSQDHTLTVWLRLRTDTTLTDGDNALSLSGADFASGTSQSINALTYNNWTKVQVTATSVASPTGSALTASLRCDEAVVIDVGPFQFEAASQASLTATGTVKPRLQVHDLSGLEYQVWAPDTDAYLQGTSEPFTDLEAVTVADFTFLVNSTKLVSQGTSVSAAQAFEALIVIDTIQPGTTINTYIDGTQESTLAIGDTDPTQLGTGRLAGLIVADFDNAGVGSGDLGAAGWTYEILPDGDGNVIYISNASDFTLSVRDEGDAEGIRVIKQQVQTFGELPRTAKQDMLMEVKGNADNDWSSFWVKYDGNDGEDGVTTWSETVGPGVTVDLDLATMPYVLTRNASGTFTIRKGHWSEQLVGDETTNAPPSFVGEYINNIFFTEGRLGLLAGENVILSASQSAGDGIFNFWRTSVTSLLDSDPIDVSTTHTKVSIMRHAVPYQEQLLLFSDQTQFRLTKGQILSPKTVGIEVLTEYESSREAPPVAVGNFVFFVVEKSDYASIREYFVSNENERNDAREISAHVPEYLPSGITIVEGTSNEDLILIHAPSDADTIYVYKYFWSGNQKVQSSFSKWTFPDVTKVIGYNFFESVLYVLFRRADGLFLERMELDQGAQDDSGLSGSLSLDRKVVTTDSNVSESYSAGTGKTTYTVSDITWTTAAVAVAIAGNTTEYPPGFEAPNEESAGTSDVVLDGDSTAEEFLFGIPYEKTYEFSEIHVKASGDRGSQVPVAEGRLQLQRIKIVYEDTGYFKVQVIQEGRADTKEYEYTGRNLGTDENLVNALPLQSGVFSVPLQSKNDRVRIKMTTTSPMPFRILSADWTGNWHARGKRI